MTTRNGLDKPWLLHRTMSKTYRKRKNVREIKPAMMFQPRLQPTNVEDWEKYCKGVQKNREQERG